jgi:glycerol-3-phosphate acyltransferase PlsY
MLRPAMRGDWVGSACVLGGYLVGSISFGLLLARRRGIDLRAEGSGNIGATNVGRVLGKRDGRIVLALDAAKGLVPALAARLALMETSPWVGAAAVAATVGHIVPVFHGFRGGKGAATAVGGLVALSPFAGAAAFATYLVGKKLSRRASVGSLLGVVAGAGTTVGLHGLEDPRTFAALALAFLVVVRHHENLARLLRGEEPES